MVSTSPHQQDSVSSGAPISVGVEYVEAQLQELWRDVAEAAQTGGGVQGVTSTHVLNIITLADNEETAQEYIRDIEEVTGHHPSRAIIMVADPNAEEEQMPAQAWVSIRCQIPPAGGRQVCAEEVLVKACGEAVRGMPAAVIPLIIPDLPVFLWWPKGTPFDDYLFRNLADSVNRLVVDSATFENPEGTLSKMPSRLSQQWPKMACSDMNFARLTHWREMLASFFDGEAARPYLNMVNRVTIDFALSERGGVNRAQALLFAGWLASRLKWEPVSPVHELVKSPHGENMPASTMLYLKSGKQQITMQLNAGPRRSATPGDLIGVKLEAVEWEGAEAENVNAAFWLTLSEKDGECAWAGVEFEGADPTQRHIQIDPPTRADLLNAELEVYSRDRIFDEALQMAGTFIRGLDPDTKSNTPATRKLVSGEPLSAGSAVKQRARPSEGRSSDPGA